MQARIRDIAMIMEKHFPLHLAEDWDNVGLQIGAEEKPVEKVVIALDIDQQILAFAIENKADLIISHHPFIFRPIKRIDYNQGMGRLIKQIIAEDIAIYCAHTNLDAAAQGLNQMLAELLGMENIEPLNRYRSEGLYKLVVFVPIKQADELRKALNEAGAGFIGEYSDCSFRVRGTGTFRPREGTTPYVGEVGQLEEVDEYRLETVIYPKDLVKILKVLDEVHPYEEVAYDIIPLVNPERTYSMGRKGVLNKETKLEEYALEVKKQLSADKIRVIGDLESPIKTVAVVSGAGAGFIDEIVAQRIDLLVTGDIKYHEAKEADLCGVRIIDAGHQETEEIMVAHLCQILGAEAKKIGFKVDFIKAYSPRCFQYL